MDIEKEHYYICIIYDEGWMFNYYLITSVFQSYVSSTICRVKNIQNIFTQISFYQPPPLIVIISVIVGMQQKVTLRYRVKNSSKK